MRSQSSTTDPTDAEINALIEQNPNGCTLDQIAAVLGVTKARAQQLVSSAVEKAQAVLRRRFSICSVDDVLSE